MPVVQVEARLSPADLLHAAEQLEPEELDTFARSVVALRTARSAGVLPQGEAELLLRINEVPDPEVARRYDHLIERRRAETLTPEEHAELLALTARMEALDGRRLEALAELAQKRGVTLRTLMQELGLNRRRSG
jgi:hypothetical protein